MRVIKFSHSCVRVEESGSVLVIDPGTWSEREAVDGADAILFTHEHPDHFDPEAVRHARVRRPDCAVFSNASVISQLPNVEGTRVVAPGDVFETAGLTVRVFGGLHAEIHPELPRVPNVGFLIEPGGLYHPGDSFDLPWDATVRTLFVPVAGTWLRMTDSVDFVRKLAPERAFPLHDGLLSEAGHTVVTGNMRLLCPQYEGLPAGTAI